MKVSETLNKAADLIEEHGWGRGNLSFLGQSGLCLEGAIYAAELGAVADTFRYGGLEECPAYRAVANHLGTRATDDDGNASRLWFWNDRRATSAGEVIEALRACAVIESARESQDEAFATYAENLEAAR